MLHLEDKSMDQISGGLVKQNTPSNKSNEVPFFNDHSSIFAAIEDTTTVENESYWKHQYIRMYGECAQFNDGVICQWWRRRFFERFLTSLVEEINTNRDYQYNELNFNQWKHTVSLQRELATTRNATLIRTRVKS